MKKGKFIVLGALVAALVAFTACGNNDNAGETTTPAEVTSPAETTTTPAEAVTEAATSPAEEVQLQTSDIIGLWEIAELREYIDGVYDWSESVLGEGVYIEFTAAGDFYSTEAGITHFGGTWESFGDGTMIMADVWEYVDVDYTINNNVLTLNFYEFWDGEIIEVVMILNRVQ